MEVWTGPMMAGPRTVAWLVVTDWDGSITMVGEKTVPVLPLKISPLPLIVALAVVPLDVEGPALKKPPAIELAITMALRLDESSGLLPRVPALMLLDRAVDIHLAKRSAADGWLIKPLDPLRIRRAVTTVVSGGTYTEGLPQPAAPAEEPAPPEESPGGEGSEPSSNAESPAGETATTG